MQEHVNDFFVKQAKHQGYRSRAAFKLLEIDERDHLLGPGMTVVDLGARWTLTRDELQYRHRHSALIGLPMCGRVKRTLSRGRTIVADGRPVGEARGRLMVPASRSSRA